MFLLPPPTLPLVQNEAMEKRLEEGADSDGGFGSDSDASGGFGGGGDDDDDFGGD